MSLPPKPVEDGGAEKILNETICSAYKIFDETIAPTKKAYEETDAQARMVCEEAVELAYEVYRKSREPFKKYYEAKRAIGIHWEEKAILDSVWDYDTTVIIDSIPDERTRNIKGKKYSNAEKVFGAFAATEQKIVYIPNWFKSYFEPYEFEWIVYHEVGHIINNHTINNRKLENPQYEEFIADEYAVRLQGRIKFGIYALRKSYAIKRASLRELEVKGRLIRPKGERTFHFADEVISLRFNRLKGLRLPW